MVRVPKEVSGSLVCPLLRLGGATWRSEDIFGNTGYPGYNLAPRCNFRNFVQFSNQLAGKNLIELNDPQIMVYSYQSPGRRVLVTKNCGGQLLLVVGEMALLP